MTLKKGGLALHFIMDHKRDSELHFFEELGTICLNYIFCHVALLSKWQKCDNLQKIYKKWYKKTIETSLHSEMKTWIKMFKQYI